MSELIKIDNFLSTNSIYFHLRERLSMRQVEGLKHIDGVTRYETRQYWVHVSVGSAFDFVEVAAPALIVLADALGVPLGELQVSVNHLYRAGDDQALIDQALAKAKELDRKHQIAVKQAEIKLIDRNVMNWRAQIKQWLANRRRLVRELKKLEQQG